MPFGTITGSNAATFEPRSAGLYIESSLTYADPTNEFRITGASPKKDGSLAGSVTRVLQKDVEYNSQTVREQSVVSLSISVPKSGSFTAAEIDILAADISEFMTPENISRILQREA